MEKILYLIILLLTMTTAYPQQQNRNPEQLYHEYGDHAFEASLNPIDLDNLPRDYDVFTGDSNYRTSIPIEDKLLKNPLKLISDEEELILDTELLQNDKTPSIKDLELSMRDEEEEDDEEDDDDEESEESELTRSQGLSKRYLFDGSSGINDSYGWYGWPSNYGKYQKRHYGHGHKHGHLPTFHHGFYTAYY